MKKSKGMARFVSYMGLDTKSERIWFSVTFVLLVLYVEAVTLFQFCSPGQQFSPQRAMVRGVVALLVCFGGVLLCRRVRLTGKRPVPGRKRTLAVFFAAFAATFAYSLIWQVACWPGFFSRDSMNQLNQAYTGVYSNWHPVLHTWLFFWLPLQLFHSSNAIITVQLVWFSLAVAYLMAVLYKNRCPWVFMVLGALYILANPNTMKIMLYPWKDSAMSIFSLVVFTQIIQIYATDGAWLKKWYHLASFSLFLFLTNSVRHNAILLIVPVFFVLFFFIRGARRRLTISAAFVLAATFLLQGPICNAAHVEAPDHRVAETMGLPMTVLSNVYVNDPDAMSDEFCDFMASLATPLEWAVYSHNASDGISDFNSIKWSSSRDMGNKLDAAGYKTILTYTAQAFRNSPKYASWAALRLTSMVWNYTGGKGWTIAPSIAPSSNGIVAAIQTFLSWLTNGCSYFPVRQLFNYIGMVILVFLFAAVSCIGGGGLGRAFLVLAPLAYDFGTMLLLSGADFRFFHFNFLVIVPLLYLFFSRKGGCAHEA